MAIEVVSLVAEKTVAHVKDIICIWSPCCIEVRTRGLGWTVVQKPA